MKITRNSREYDIQSVCVDSGKSGKHLLFFGAIHGNEICGPQAIEKIVGEFERGERIIDNGMITFVPVCNPRAYAANVREVEQNLNRVFYAERADESYEAGLAPVLTKFIDACDIFLDLHSYRDKTVPFIMNDYYKPEVDAWINALFPEDVIEGWPELYPGGGDTLAYAHNAGKSGLVIECGFHSDESSVENAYRLIDETLYHFGLSARKTVNHNKKPKNIGIMKELICRPDKSAVLKEDLKNFTPFKSGDVLYTSKDGGFNAGYDGFIVMPKHGAAPGQEWFYMAAKKIISFYS